MERRGQQTLLWFFFWLIALYPWVILPPQAGLPGKEGLWITPKLLLLIGLVSLTTPLWLSLSSHKIPKTLVLFQIIWILAACLLALPHYDEATDIWLGPENRTDGLIYQVSVLLLALALFRLETHLLQNILLPLLILSGTYQAILWLWQRSGLDPINSIIPYAMEGPPGTIGNPGMAAGLALPLIPLALVLWMKDKRHSWLAAAFILALGLGSLSNRSSLLALAVGLGFLVLIAKDRRLTLISATLLATSFASHAYWPRIAAPAKDLTNTNTLATRIQLWNLGLSVLFKDPKTFVFGLGPRGLQQATATELIPLSKQLTLFHLEYGWPPQDRLKTAKPLWAPADPVTSRTYLLEYDTRGLPAYEKKYGETLVALQKLANVDRAHNAWLDKALAFGVPLAMVWLLFFLTPIPKLLLGAPDPLKMGLAVSLATLFVYYLTWFAVPQTEPWHYTLAVLAWKIAEK
ncbi:MULTISPECIES: hypothetical protein [Thermus]|uniref:O-Antigen ligase n=1 Tax=Thermus brockianus TaxID=56956 RepID=A0A1J0LR11_THEBO|nr:hypothetical protein [Thermus brockianus]APD08704.1 hypothetical protein A0O31_00496 [Thermus brockianus]